MLTEVDLEQRIGPVLSDGTTLRDLIDFDRREVSIRVLNDLELHRIELDRIFARSWIGLAHESEIPNPGDYVLRSIGEDGVIVTRDLNGKVNVLLNVCTHRGMEVCWGSTGNSASFRCGYHGWIFDNEGNLRGVPLEQEMYGDWDKSEYGLERARVELRHGVIYANFDDAAMPLDEYLGDLSFYHEFMFGGVDWEPLGPPWRLDIAVNWKAAADQNSGDAYHFAGAHRPFVEVGMVPEAGLASMVDIVKVMFPSNGHHLFSMGAAGMGAERSENLEERYPYEGASFSQLIFPANVGRGGAGGIGPGATGLPRTAMLGWYVPDGPGLHAVYHLDLIDKNATEEERAAARKMSMLGVAMAIDDQDAWQSMQYAAKGAVARRRTMKYNALETPRQLPHWKGPGEVFAGTSCDATQWNFWKTWFAAMTADEA